MHQLGRGSVADVVRHEGDHPVQRGNELGLHGVLPARGSAALVEERSVAPHQDRGLVLEVAREDDQARDGDLASAVGRRVLQTKAEHVVIDVGRERGERSIARDERLDLLRPALELELGPGCNLGRGRRQTGEEQEGDEGQRALHHHADPPVRARLVRLPHPKRSMPAWHGVFFRRVRPSRCSPVRDAARGRVHGHSLATRTRS